MTTSQVTILPLLNRSQDSIELIHYIHYSQVVRKRIKTALITAGPTLEPIDPIRFLSNRSSGKMGYALAKAALRSGYRVILVSGPTRLQPPKGCQFFAVKTARAMEKICLHHAPKADIIIKTAAVADYRPLKVARDKIKKKTVRIKLILIKNRDILKLLGKKKRSGQTLVGFAAETKDLVPNALKKIAEKNLDWIVLNDVSRPGIGFESDQNAVTLISAFGVRIKLPKQHKVKLAAKIFKIVSGEAQLIHNLRFLK